MLKRKNKKALPEQLEDSLYPDDYWLDKEDGQEVSEPLPDGENPVSGKLRKEPMVTGYEALERQRGVRRPKRKITRREKKALKQAQKYEAKLRKEQERADKKSEKREAKLAEKAEKEAKRQAKKDAKKRKSKQASTSGQKAAGNRKPVKTGTNKTAVKADTAKEKQISAQQSIPYHEMAKDGICRVQDKFYSKTIRFYDINYQLAQNEDKNAIFENWCDFLNYFDSTIHFQLSFINQHSNMAEFEKVILIKPQDDEFDELRMEFAQMLKNQLSKGNNGLLRTKYITFGIEADSIREAKPKLERIESDILNNFKILGVSAYPLNGEERLQIMYETFNQDSKVPFHFSYDDVLRTGLSTKDYVAPTSFVFKNGRDFQMGGTIGAVSYLQILAPELTDKMLAEFLEMDCNLMVNLHIQSIDQMKAIKLVKSKVTDINRMKIEEQKKAAGITEPKNLEEQAISLVGTDIYEKLIKGYTQKQWGRKCTDLPAFFIKRLPVRLTFDNNYFNALYQGIPMGGYTKMVEHLLEGIEVRLGIDYLEQKEELKALAEKTVYTGAIDAYFDYSLGALEYRSVRFETELLDTPNFQGNAAVNYTDAQTPWTRIIEHKWFEFGKDDEGHDLPKTVISREYSSEWKPGDEPYYPVNDEKNGALYQKYKELAEKEKNVIFGGRLGEYKYYDMDAVIASALEMCEKELG